MIKECKIGDYNGYKWNNGKCYLYTNKKEKKEAKRKALVEGISSGDIIVNNYKK